MENFDTGDILGTIFFCECSPTAEAVDLKSIQCGFESHSSYLKKEYARVLTYEKV